MNESEKNAASKQDACSLHEVDLRTCGTENMEPKRWRVEFRSITGIWALQCECDSSEEGARKTAEMICTERRRDTRVVEVTERRKIICHYPLSSPNEPRSETGSAQETARTGEARPAPSLPPLG